MSSGSTKNRRARFRFSLGNLLSLTAIIAVWIASFLVLRRSTELEQTKTQLLALSSHLQVLDADQLQSKAYPRVADDFATWEIHVPERGSFELRFAVGEVSKGGMPEAFDSVPLERGRHRITLQSEDGSSSNFRYVVFVDGQSVFDQTLGREWMPDGWAQASGLNLPRIMDLPGVAKQEDSSPLQLVGRVYLPRIDYEPRSYFNGRSDEWVSRPGYRLWIDHVEQTYEPTSPFTGFQNEHNYHGIGLRNGLRLQTTRSNQYDWTITRPAAQTRDPALRIVPEFFAGHQRSLSDQTKAFAWWRLRNEATGKNSLSWKRDATRTSYRAFLHAEIEAPNVIEPVVEVRWDASRGDDMGFRLADTPANDELIRWGLRIVGGESHLWRLVDVGDREIDVRQIDVRQNLGNKSPEPSGDPLTIEFNQKADDAYQIRWRTDIAKPLQLLTRRRKTSNLYNGMDLFQGLPLSFEAELAATLQPVVSIVPAWTFPGQSKTPIPGGPVAAEIEISLDASVHDWVWLRARPRMD